jgi:F0F1-type ATP synthase membrane subunit a
MSTNDKKKRRTRSLALVLLAWIFIGGQALLAAGSLYNYNAVASSEEAVEGGMPWGLIGEGAHRVRLIAMQAQPDVIGNIAVFLAVANALGLAGLVFGLLSWSRSNHASGKLTIAVSVAVILANSILNLAYA